MRPVLVEDSRRMLQLPAACVLSYSHWSRSLCHCSQVPLETFTPPGMLLMPVPKSPKSKARGTEELYKGPHLCCLQQSHPRTPNLVWCCGPTLGGHHCPPVFSGKVASCQAGVLLSPAAGSALNSSRAGACVEALVTVEKSLFRMHIWATGRGGR